MTVLIFVVSGTGHGHPMDLYVYTEILLLAKITTSNCRLMNANGSNVSIHPYLRAWIWRMILMASHLTSLDKMQHIHVHHRICTLKRTRTWRASLLNVWLVGAGYILIHHQNVWKVRGNHNLKKFCFHMLMSHLPGVTCTDPPPAPVGGDRVWSGRVKDGSEAR